MKKMFFISVICMTIVACGSKSGKSTQSSQEEWEKEIVGDWVWEQNQDSVMDEMVSSHASFQVFYSIKADGTMKETEHQYLKFVHKKVEGLVGDNEAVVSDDDQSIFTGTWRLSNDTLYKEGVLSTIQEGTYEPGQEIPRKEQNVKGYTVISRITKDSLFVVGKDGNITCFVKMK